jgi:hypothetical protein
MSFFGTHSPSDGGGVACFESASTGTGAERAFREEAPLVVFAGVAGGESGTSLGFSISPVQATTV